VGPGGPGGPGRKSPNLTRLAYLACLAPEFTMRVAVLHVELFIPYALSLKDKRMVLRRVKDRLGKFNVAVAEVEHQDVWQRAALGIVAISTTADHVEQQLSAAADEIDRVEPGLVTRTELEFLA
jgi:uncharacterized protein